MKIGEKEVPAKVLVLGVILALVVVSGVVAMVKMQGGKPGGAVPGKLSYPRGIAVDGQGSLYVADSRNHRIEKLKTADLSVEADFGSYTSLAGSDAKKLVSEAPGKLNEPNGLSVGPDGNLYVIDTWNSRIQVFSPKGKHKRTFTTEDGFFGPREIVVDAKGAAYVADTGKHRIVKFDAEGKKVRAWGTKGDGEGQFNEPIGLGLDGTGNLYVADRLNFRVQVFDPDGKFLREWEVNGWTKEQIDMEPHLAVDQARGLVYVTDGRGLEVKGPNGEMRGAVYCYDLKGKKKATIAMDSAGVPFGVPIGVAVDKDGGLYVVDAAKARVVKLQGVQP